MASRVILVGANSLSANQLFNVRFLVLALRELGALVVEIADV